MWLKSFGQRRPLESGGSAADAPPLERLEALFHLDTRQALGKTISRIGYPCLASMQGRQGDRGWGVGNYPRYQQFLLDYVRFAHAGAK